MTNDHSQLLLDIEKKSNIVITKVRHVKCLKEEIESYKDLKIGFNTLRRLFGFLEKTKPTLATLNTLARYLEYRSYAGYLSNKLNFDAWYFQQKLLLIQQKNDLNKTDFNSINEGVQYGKNIIYVAYFVSNLILENNLGTLNSFFKKIELSKIDFSYLLQFATIITHSFYRIDENKAIIIYNDLIKHASFKNTVPLLYIDYSNLNGIYLKVLRLLAKHSPVISDLFFVMLMEFYRDFYTEGICNRKEIKLPIGFSKFNPVLKGRFYAYTIMSSTAIDNNLKRKLFKECSTNRISWFLEEVIPALLIKEEYKILKELSDQFYEEIFESKAWSDKTMSSIFLIGLANISWYNNEISSAKRSLELVVLEKMELSYYNFISLFYYLTELKVSHGENAIETNAAAFIILKQLVLKTGFERFIGASEKYILN